MPLDFTKDSTPIVIRSDKELMARAQSQQSYYRDIEDIPAGKCFAVLAIQLKEPLTPEQYFSLIAEARERYGAEGVEMMYEGIIPSYGDDYQIDFQTSCNLVPRKKAVEVTIPGKQDETE